MQEISDEFNVVDPYKLVQDYQFVDSIKKSVEGFGLYRRALHLLNESKKIKIFHDLLKDEKIPE